MDDDDLRGIEEATAKVRAARLEREQAEQDRKERLAKIQTREAAALAIWKSDAGPLFEKVLASLSAVIDPAEITFGLHRDDEGRAHPLAAFNFTSASAGRQTCVVRQFELGSNGQIRTYEAYVSPDGRKAVTGPHSDVAPVDALNESQVLKPVRQSLTRFAELDAA